MESWDLAAPHQRLPVSLLTGFLGSGKTSVLNHLVRHPALKRTLVIVNEFGAIGLDHELITHSDEDVVVEMSSGCLCCTIRGDLVRTLRDAIWRFARDGKPWFDRVIIETTGLADPAPVLHTLMTDRVISRQYRLDGVIATVDAASGMTTLDRQIESVKQAAVADRLLLTKVDLVEPASVSALIERLGALNPSAPIIPTVNGEVDPGKVLDAGLYNPTTKSLDVRRWLNAESFADTAHHDHASHGDARDVQTHGHEPHHGSAHHGHDHDVNRHDDHISALCLTLDDPIPGDAFDRWLEALLLLKGPDILRVKGIVNIQGLKGPFVIHGVQHIFHPPVMLKKWPGKDRRTRIVFIARDLDRSALQDMLEIFTAEPARRDQQTPVPDPKESGGSDVAPFEVRR